MTLKIKFLTHLIYDILGMKGIVRIDYIIIQEGIPSLNEINSIPKMSTKYIVSQMIKPNKKSFVDMLK